MKAAEPYIQARSASKNMKFLKCSNRAAVIRALALKKAVSRTDLAEYLNLTKMTISNIVNELIEEAFISEISSYGKAPDIDELHTGGRRRKHLTINNWAVNAICMNIRRYSVSCMLMDISGNTAHQNSRALPENADNDYLMRILSDFIKDILLQAPQLAIAGIGISSIGPLDIYHKHLLDPPDFRKIHDLHIGESLETLFHIPVYMDNDMNCSALAELFFGEGNSHRDLVFLGFSSGVGAGIISNERIMHGFGGFAGEVGHISINPYGALCPCGQHGCIELYTRGENLLKNIGVENFDELNQLITLEEPPRFVLNCLKEYTDAMHSLVVAIANSYDPDIVILGDINMEFIQKLIPDLEEHMNHFMLNHGYKHIQMKPSLLESAAPLYGAGSIVFQRVFDGEIVPSKLSRSKLKKGTGKI